MDYPPPGSDPNNPYASAQQPPYQPSQPGYPPPPVAPSQAGYPPPPPGYPGQSMYPPPPAGPSQPMYPPPPAGPSQPMYPPPPGYGQPMGYGAPPYVTPNTQGDGMAVAGVILGALSIPIAVVGLCGFIFGVLGLIFSLQGRASPRNHTLANVGIVLSAIGLAFSVLPMVSNLPFFTQWMFPI